MTTVHGNVLSLSVCLCSNNQKNTIVAKQQKCPCIFIYIFFWRKKFFLQNISLTTNIHVHSITLQIFIPWNRQDWKLFWGALDDWFSVILYSFISVAVVPVFYCYSGASAGCTWKKWRRRPIFVMYIWNRQIIMLFLYRFRSV